MNWRMKLFFSFLTIIVLIVNTHLLWTYNKELSSPGLTNSRDREDSHAAYPAPETIEPGLTVEDVYRMIIEYKFFCHSKDYGYHFKVLEKLRKVEKINKLDSVYATFEWDENEEVYKNYSYIFKTGRKKKAFIIPGKTHYIIKTISTNKEKPEDQFILYWAPTVLEFKTYEQALEMMAYLNRINFEGYSDWRLPTIRELFSITGYYDRKRNFFPFDYEGNFTKTMQLWTSTPLEEREKKRITSCGSSAYFVADCIHKSYDHRLHFGILCENRRAYILPVRSRPTTTDNRMIIAHLAFMKPSDSSSMISSKLGQSINKPVTRGIIMAEAANSFLAVNEKILRQFNSVTHANRLTNILFDPHLTNEKKMDRIIQRLMIPNHVDLIVTGFFIDDGSTEWVTVRPMVICKYSKEILTKNLQLKRTWLVCLEPSSRDTTLCKEAYELIANAVKELLEIL